MAAERAPAMDTLLLVFARAPRRGRVKTRLVPELGEDTALDVHQRLLDRTLREAAASATGHHTNHRAKQTARRIKSKSSQDLPAYRLLVQVERGAAFASFCF